MPDVSRKKQMERKERTVATKSGPQNSKSPSRLIDEKALKALVRAAVTLNASRAKG